MRFHRTCFFVVVLFRLSGLTFALCVSPLISLKLHQNLWQSCQQFACNPSAHHLANPLAVCTVCTFHNCATVHGDRNINYRQALNMLIKWHMQNCNVP